MITVNLREAARITEAAILADMPVLLMGHPGIGKTSVFKSIANKLGIGCRIEDGSSLDPVDARGVCVPDMKTRESFFTRPAIFPTERDGKKGILVIDEVGGMIPAAQKAIQSIFLERRSGEHILEEGWIPVGTGNYATDGAGAFSLLTSFEDRVAVFNVEPDYPVWKEDFALPNDLDHRIISFLNFRTELFSTFNKRNKNEKGKSFVSPRSWEKASKLLKTGVIPDSLMLPAMAGCIGEGVATEFVAHLKVHNELPRIESIYKGKYENVPSKPDVLYALTGALVAYLSRLPKDLSKEKAVERFLKYVMMLPAEFAVLAMKDAIVLHKSDILASKPHFSNFSKKFEYLIIA